MAPSRPSRLPPLFRLSCCACTADSCRLRHAPQCRQRCRRGLSHLLSVLLALAAPPMTVACHSRCIPLRRRHGPWAGPTGTHFLSVHASPACPVCLQSRFSRFITTIAQPPVRRWAWDSRTAARAGARCAASLTVLTNVSCMVRACEPRPAWARMLPGPPASCPPCPPARASLCSRTRYLGKHL